VTPPLGQHQPPDDQLLIRYLIGALPDVETERLDELSITDDDVASRLRALEHDLVDAYVKGELSGETLDLFRSHYLASPAQRERVRFAEVLSAHQTSTVPATPRKVVNGHRTSVWRRLLDWGLRSTPFRAR